MSDPSQKRKKSMSNRKAAGSLVAFILMAGGGFAQEETERFQLFNFCRPMRLSVAYHPPEDSKVKIDLTEETIQAAVESRLRSARLYDSEASTRLHVSVHMVGRAFSTDIAYFKLVYDPTSELVDQASVWLLAGTGTTGGSGEFILSNLQKNMDKFLVEYLRVNEKACGGPEKQGKPSTKGFKSTPDSN